MIGYYVGIDQSYGGCAIAAYDPLTIKPKLYRKAHPAATYGSGVDRTLWVGAWIALVLRDIGLDAIVHVAMEGYSRGSKFRREEAGALAHEVQRVLHSHLRYNNVGYPTIVAPTARAKFATGHGGADKKAVIAAIKRKWRVEIPQHDEADAYVLARIAKEVHVGNLGIRRVDYEQEVLDGLTPHTHAPKPGQKIARYSYMQVT